MQLGYLNFHGKGQVSRLLFAYTKQPFEDIKYSFSQFREKKESFGLDFPNLPYLIDGNFKITQHEAIQRYIILKSKHKKLLGLNSKQKGVVDNLKGVLKDIDKILIPTILSPNFKQIRRQNYQNLKNKLDLIQKFVGNKQFLLQKVCYADFHLSIIFGYFKIAYPQQFKSYPNIIRITQNFMNLPQIKEYYQSQTSVKALFPPMVDIQKFKNLDSVQLKSQEKMQQQNVKKQEKKSEQLLQEKNQKKISQESSKPSQIQQEKPTAIKLQHKQTSQRPIDSKLKEYLKKVQSTNAKSSVVMPISEKTSDQVIKPSQMKYKQSSMPWMNSQKQKSTGDKSAIVFGRSVNQNLAQKLLFQYLKIEYKQVVYENQETFNKDLSKLSLDFSALPYLIDDKLNLSSSLAIDRYVISKFGQQSLMGKSLKDNAKTQNLVKLAFDILKQLRFKAKKYSNQEWKKGEGQKFFTQIKQKLDQIEKFVGINSYAMEYLTFADLILTELSFQIKKHFQKEYEQYQFFQRIKKELSTYERLKILIQLSETAK